MAAPRPRARTDTQPTPPTNGLPAQSPETAGRPGRQRILTRRTPVLSLLLLSLLLSAFAPTAAQAASEQSFQVAVEGQTFTATLPASSVATYVWHPKTGSVESWLTTPANAASQAGIAPQPPISFTSSNPTLPAITVSPSEHLQTIDGFGGAMTESAAYVIRNSPLRSEILQRLFAPPPDGAGLSIVRVPLGPSDFTVTKKKPTEYTRAGAEEWLMPALKEAEQARAPGPLKILATPWSAPGKMKIGKHLTGAKVCSGSNDYLQNAKYSEYAAYLTKAVLDYQQAGLPIWTLSLQNEPHNCNSTYPTMKMEPADQAALSRILYEQLHSPQSGVTSPPALLGWDHNWNDYNNNPANAGNCSAQTPSSFPESLFQLENAITALGYHGYCGQPRAPLGVPRSLPFYMTEATGITQYPNAAQNLPNEVQHDLIDPLRVGVKASLYWNLALNPQCGPQYGGLKTCTKPSKNKYGGCVGCRPLITVNSDGTYQLNQDYYYWAQLAEFMQPGARVIASSTTGELDTLAVANPDGTIALAVLNSANTTAQHATPVAAAASTTHACAITVAATLLCWGENREGVLGDHTTEAKLTPVEVTGLGPVLATANTEWDACAVLISGGVQCWGNNNNGQLGNGSENPSLTPVMAGLTEAQAIATGISHTCALIADGTVDCWGANNVGQIGPTKITTKGFPESTHPVQVTGVDHATAIAAASSYSCALKTEGTIDCWGENTKGQLGRGTSENSSTPAPVTGIATASAIAAGDNHACAVLQDHTVFCWGANNAGQLGNGSLNPSTTPVQVAGIENAVSVTAGLNHSCAVLTDRTIECWGAGGDGELGNGESGNGVRSTIPVHVSGLSGALDVTAGATQTCAVLETGGARCWGANYTGQLGDGLTEPSPLPVQVTGFQ